MTTLYRKPLYAAINVSTAGDNTLVAAVAGKRIRVLSYTLVCSAVETVRFESGAGGTALTGQMEFGANGGAAVTCDHGLFETAAGALLNLELATGVNVDGHLTYVLIDES